MTGAEIFVIIMAPLLFWTFLKFVANQSVEKAEPHELHVEISKKMDEETSDQTKKKEVFNSFREVIRDLGLIDKINIAKNTVQRFPDGEYEEVREHISNDKQKIQVLGELNEKIKDKYEENLLIRIGGSFELNLDQSLSDKVINEIMELGFGIVLKKYGLENNDRSSDQSSGREISKTGKWKDIKKKL
jgi:hypothetical protein